MSDTATIAVDKEIDARGSFCPGPLMELIRGMKTLPIGGTLAVLSGDPGRSKTFRPGLRRLGMSLLATEPHEGYTRFVARKAR